MRRFASVALVLVAACGEALNVEPGPTRAFYRPTGIDVYGGSLVVASSNFDLRYDGATGGSVIAVDPLSPAAGYPALAPWLGGVNIESFAGELAVADPARCAIPSALALVPARGADVLYRIPLAADGAPSCGDGCALSLRGHDFTDPFAVTVACGPGLARAYVGYLRSVGGNSWLTQIDLTKADLGADGAVQHTARGLGQMRGFAYDPVAKRLYVAQTATSASAAIRWIELSNDCRIDATELEGGCRGGVVPLPPGLEAHGIALGNGNPRRMYVAVRIFDTSAAAAAGVRVGDLDGLLLVADLADDFAGQTRLQVVKEISMGYGLTALRLLPARSGKRDVVAVLAADDGVLWLFDDETDALAAIGREAVTGHPRVGGAPYGLAVDPTARGGVVRVYVGSFAEDFVIPIDVPLDDVDAWTIPQSGGADWRIRGGTP